MTILRRDPTSRLKASAVWPLRSFPLYNTANLIGKCEIRTYYRLPASDVRSLGVLQTSRKRVSLVIDRKGVEVLQQQRFVKDR